MKHTKFYSPPHTALPREFKLNAADERQARELARVLTLIDRHALGAMLDGLGREIAAMLEAREWTRDGSEEEQFRRLRLETAVVAHTAVRMAMARLD